MKTFKVSHTPAHRWQVIENNGGIYLRILSEKDQFMIYKLSSDEDNAIFPHGRAEVKANAKIIGLAPRLLHACKIAFEELDRLATINPPTPDQEAMLDMLDDLIKKAETI